MRQFLLIVGVLAVLGTAHAAPVWSGPGWYQVEFSPGGYRLIAGPFGDAGACEASLPGDGEEEEYDCKNLSEKPSGSQWWGADFPGT
jgi:hypothetical protein